jgi:beta-galactosidase
MPVFKVDYYDNVLANGGRVLGHTARPPTISRGLPRLGLRMEIPSTQQTLTWFERGSHETYRDRNTGARIDSCQAPVSGQYSPTLCP